jgi:hypothetical protein
MSTALTAAQMASLAQGGYAAPDTSIAPQAA